MSSATTGDAGVGLARFVIGRELGWAFRELPTMDFGVDAEVERLDAGSATGQLIGLQIKTGDSYFSPHPEGWVYRPKDRHVTYWLGHSLPIVVVLVDPESMQLYWQAINADTLSRSSRGGWKLIVPRINRVHGALQSWTEIAQARDDEALRRYEANHEALPPAVQKLVTEMRSDKPLLAARIAQTLTHQRAATDAQNILRHPPSWIAERPKESWAIVASFAIEHELFPDAAEALLRAVEQGHPNSHSYSISAALYLHDHEPVRSKELLAAAKAQDAQSPKLNIISKLLQHPTGPLPSLDSSTMRSDDEGIKATREAYLRETAARRHEYTTSIRHGEAAARLAPTNTQYPMSLVQLYLKRSTGSESGPDDLGTALKIANNIIQKRRRWSGPLLEPVLAVLQAHMLRRDTAALKLDARLWPDGLMTPELSQAPQVAEALFRAYLVEGDADAATAVAETVTDEATRAKLHAQLLALNGSGKEQIATWTEIAATARQAGNASWLAGAVFHLALLGMRSTEDVNYLRERGALTSIQVSVLEAIAETRNGSIAGAERLRRLADTDLTAAEAYVDHLASTGSIDDALQAAERAATRLRAPQVLVQTLELAIAAGHESASLAISNRLLSDHRITGASRLQALHVQTMDANRLQDWPRAEDLCSAALAAEAQDFNPAWVWRLIIAQVNQRADKRAVETWLRYRPAIRDEGEARLWLHVNQYLDWSDEDVDFALTIERRFAHDRAISAGILTQIFMTGSEAPGAASDSGDDEEAPYAHRLQAQLSLHMERHGETGGIRAIQGTPEELLEQITTMAKLRASHISDFVRQVAGGALPFGLLTNASGKPYSLVVAMGEAPLVIGAMDPQEFEQEVDLVEAAGGNEVVVALDALHAACLLHETEDLLGYFRELFLYRGSRDDLLRAVVEARNGSVGGESLVWSEAEGRLVWLTSDQQRAEATQMHLRKMESISAEMTLSGVESMSQFQELPIEKVGPWLGPLQLAHETGRPLWTDDRVLRQLAASIGVKSFGTMALLHHLNDAGGDFDSATVIKAFTRANLVNLPMTVLLWKEIVVEDDYAPLAAARICARPTFWLWIDDVVDDFREVVGESERRHPGSRRAWRRAAMRGIAQLPYTQDPSSHILGFALLGAGEADNNSIARSLAEGVVDARVVCAEFKFPDPTAHLVSYVHEFFEEILTPEGLADLVRQVRAELDKIDSSLGVSTDDSTRTG